MPNPGSGDEQRSIDIILLTDCIDRIARSPIGKEPASRSIVSLLKSYLAGGRIRFAKAEKLEGDRGAWDGHEILINEEFRGNLGKTMPTLVHEAAHAVWRAGHPLSKKRRESPDEGGENEYHSVLIETRLYKWLRDEAKLAQPELEMERRVTLLDSGKLQTTTIHNYKERLRESQERAKRLMQQAGQ